MSEFYLVPEVAERLRCSKPKVYDLLHRGELVSVKIGRKRLISVESVDSYIANNVDHDIASAADRLNRRANAANPVTDPTVVAKVAAVVRGGGDHAG